MEEVETFTSRIGLNYVISNFVSTFYTVSILLIWISLTYLILKKVYAYFVPSNWNPKGKHVYITGGSQGLGKSLAIQLAKLGADITIVARKIEVLRLASDEIKAARISEKQKVNYVVGDVSSNESAINALKEATRLVGRCPEYVFTIAGSSIPGYLLNLDVKQYETQMKLNYLGTVYTIKEASRLMLEANVKGKLITCSSLAALVGFIGYSAYSPSKHAVRGFSEILRQEMLLYDIDVHCLFPGSILTEGFNEENKIKPKITLELEGTDGMTPEAVARESIKGLSKGETFIVCEPLGEIFLACGLGFLPCNNLFTHAICIGLSWIVCPALRLYSDFKVKQERNQNLKQKDKLKKN
ncbi:3-dehydrosphinganine reductase [Clydaea vesicula]|uniref:3-dehydrosphinganine reductase n=1 Tax=Clydaea vesicula TaxID=447962 RepID=A0AAD5U3G2_9FUNG|nr:3-dehydrosphinganine reductase [Clydaea vesicula]